MFVCESHTTFRDVASYRLFWTVSKQVLCVGDVRGYVLKATFNFCSLFSLLESVSRSVLWYDWDCFLCLSNKCGRPKDTHQLCGVFSNFFDVSCTLCSSKCLPSHDQPTFVFPLITVTHVVGRDIVHAKRIAHHISQSTAQGDP
jgi:hypothetical protein